MVRLKKILITGGACAGKTTIINVIKDYLEEKKYNVSIFEEVPTKLINEGINSEKIGKMSFQELVIKTQLENEKKCNYDGVIIFDGSPIDSLKFISRDEFDNLVNKYDSGFENIIGSYDAIIFLETVAKKYPEFYSNKNNKARLTDLEAAVARNDKLFNIYNRNSKVYLIKSESNFDNKKKKVIEIIERIIK